MNESKFLDLIEEYGGFELTLGFRGDVDHFIGGTGNKVWYVIQKGSKSEYWIGTLTNGEWSDRHYIKRGKLLTADDAENGSTAAKAAGLAYFGMDFIEKEGRKPVEITDRGMKILHYTYKFGEIAYDISEQYGVTVCYSNINDEAAGYRMRDVTVGKAVKPPKELK